MDFIQPGGKPDIRPEQLEMVLNEHPDIKEVSVISVSREAGNRNLRAIIVPMKENSLTEADIISWCREKLGGEGCPQSVVFARELPRNRVGKLSMRDIQKRFG